MRLFSSKKKSELQIGLEFQSRALAAAVYKRGAIAEVQLLEGNSFEDQLQALKAWVHKKRLTSKDTVVAMDPSHYQLFLLEPPEVPANELREAMRWKLKDLLNYPLEEAVVDVFPMPDNGVKGNKKMVYVVASPRKTLARIVEGIKTSDLQLTALDITELCIRNLAIIHLEPAIVERGVAIVKLADGSGSVFLLRQNNLYLSRNFRLDYRGGLLDDLPEETLAVEIQRSIDYYERQMGQPTPAGVYLCGENVLEDKIGSILTSSFSMPVNLFEAGLDIPTVMDADLGQACLVATGAALRERVY